MMMWRSKEDSLAFKLFDSQSLCFVKVHTKETFCPTLFSLLHPFIARLCLFLARKWYVRVRHEWRADTMHCKACVSLSPCSMKGKVSLLFFKSFMRCLYRQPCKQQVDASALDAVEDKMIGLYTPLKLMPRVAQILVQLILHAIPCYPSSHNRKSVTLYSQNLWVACVLLRGLMVWNWVVMDMPVIIHPKHPTRLHNNMTHDMKVRVFENGFLEIAFNQNFSSVFPVKGLLWLFSFFLFISGVIPCHKHLKDTKKSTKTGWRHWTQNNLQYK